jgi:hypothetical protein
MYRRLLYFVLLIAVAAGFWIRGEIYVHHVLSGLAGTAAGLLELAYLITMVSFASIILRNLLRRGDNRREVPVTVKSIERGGTSLSAGVVRLQATAKRAFVHQPVLACALLFVAVAALAGVPIGLLALATPGGFTAFGPVEWLVLGLAELPVVLFVFLVVSGLRSGDGSSSGL